MLITVAYMRKDFWGSYEPTRDTNKYATIKDLQKAFNALKRDHEFVIHIEEKYSIFYDSLIDWEKGIVTVREFEAWNSYDEKKVAFEKIKKEIMSRYK